MTYVRPIVVVVFAALTLAAIAPRARAGDTITVKVAVLARALSCVGSCYGLESVTGLVNRMVCERGC